MRIGTAIQIGIEYTTEYAYLLKPDWKTSHTGLLKDIPEVLKDDYDDWNYVAVDSDISSVLEGITVNKDFVCAHITGKTEAIKRATYKDGKTCVYTMFSISLSDFINLQYINQIDVLALDVEGAEVEILQGYDWKVKPRFITVEFHKDFPNVNISTKDFITFIQKQGYNLIHSENTNYDETIELQFLETT